MNVIEVTDLVKRYGDRTAVDGVSFSVEEGEIFAILGPNGAGKTTTVESISGLRTPDSGTIRVLGLDPQRDRDELRRVVGVQLQESELPDQMRVREAVELYASFYAGPRDGERLLADLGLADKRKSQFGKLSGGEKQRLSIALALIGNPKIAILDELTTGLDPQARRDTWQLIEDVRAGGVTVILVTHFMEEAERLADRIALIDAGRVVALDTPAGIVVPRRRRAAAPVPAVRPDRRRAPDRAARGPQRDAGTARRSRSPAPATSSRPSRRSSRATRSSPTSCGSNRRTSTTRSSRSPAASSPASHQRSGDTPMLKTLTLSETRLFFREPGVWLLTILLPTIVLVVVGLAVRRRAGPGRSAGGAGSTSSRRRWSS